MPTNVFNLTDCFRDANNTGTSGCVPQPGALRYDIALPRGTRISLADAQPDTFMATLNAITKSDNPATRGYVIGSYVSVADSSTEPITESYDQGAYQTIYDGAYTWMRRAVEGGLCAHSNMRQFNKKQDKFDFLIVFQSTDTQYTYYVMGTKKNNITTGEVELAGVRYTDIYADKWKPAEGTTSAGYYLKTNMVNVRQINEDRLFVPIKWDVADLARINSVTLTVAKVSTGIFDVTAINECSGLSLADLYPALAAPGAFTVLNDLGATVTVTGVTIVNDNFRLALDTTDADYTAGATFTFALKPISVTSATPYNVQYVEGNTTAPIAK
jgi:hypothetical protein